jgi:hypothetical protein
MLLLLLLLLLCAVLRCWAGPTAVNISRTESSSKAISAAVDVSFMLVTAAIEINGRNRQDLRNMLGLDYNSISTSHDLQWLLCCYLALSAQAVHKQQKGQQQLLTPAAGSSQPQ